jgi:hypothetical protein
MKYYPKDEKSERTTDGPPSARGRYERPRILSREPLEVVAAMCAPAPPAKSSPLLCILGPISS